MTATTIALKLNSGAAAGSHYFEVIEAFVQFTVGSRDYNCRGNSMLLGSMGQRIGGRRPGIIKLCIIRCKTILTNQQISSQ